MKVQPLIAIIGECCEKINKLVCVLQTIIGERVMKCLQMFGCAQNVLMHPLPLKIAYFLTLAE